MSGMNGILGTQSMSANCGMKGMHSTNANGS